MVSFYKGLPFWFIFESTNYYNSELLAFLTIMTFSLGIGYLHFLFIHLQKKFRKSRKLLQNIDKFKVQPLNNYVKLPERKTTGSAGYDLYLNYGDVTLNGNELKIIKSGFKMQIPKGYYAKIEPRSSSVIKARINTRAGIIDSDYRDEVGIVLIYERDSQKHPPYQTIPKGERIAQMIIMKYEDFPIAIVGKLDDSDRIGGFGSTGKK